MRVLVWSVVSGSVMLFLLACQESKDPVKVDKPTPKVLVKSEVNPKVATPKESNNTVPKISQPVATQPKTQTLAPVLSIESTQEQAPHGLVREDFVDINLTAKYHIPENALFVDIRDTWERRVYGGYPKDSIVVVYQFRKEHAKNKHEDKTQRKFNPDFVDTIGDLVAWDKARPIVLICATGSRTGAEGNHTKASAAKLLVEGGFLDVSHIRTGIWGEGGWSHYHLPWVAQ